MSRYHPSRWPLGLWVAISVAAGLLRVPYTLAGFSFSPAVALLSGTWLGWRRAGPVQAAAAAIVVPVTFLIPDMGDIGDWGYRLGLIGSAMLAGVIARPDGTGAHPSPLVRLAVFGVAGATVALVLTILPGQSAGVMFALVFLLAIPIALFYAYRMVPEPGRVVGYAFCLLPYFGAGVLWNLVLVNALPARAVLAGIPARWEDLVLHAYLAQLPPDVITLVVISYLVCAIDRGGTAEGPMTISASR